MERTKKFLVGLLATLSVLAGSLGLAACDLKLGLGNGAGNQNSSSVKQSSNSNVSSEEENGSDNENSSDGENGSDDENGSDGNHAWATEFSYDNFYHWVDCDSCDEIKDKQSHIWDNGTITTPPTAEADGVKTYTCEICEQTKTEDVEYVPNYQVSPQDWINGFDATLLDNVTLTGSIWEFESNEISLEIRCANGNSYEKDIFASGRTWESYYELVGTSITNYSKYSYQNDWTIEENYPFFYNGQVLLSLMPLNEKYIEFTYNESSHCYEAGEIECVNFFGTELYYERVSLRFEDGRVVWVRAEMSTPFQTQEYGVRIEAYEFDFSNYGNTVVDFSACKESLMPTEGIVYEVLSETTAQVVGYNGTATSVRIAETYNGVPVTKIGEMAFYRCDSLTSIVIPNSVTSIGEYAFAYCESLSSVVIGNGVTSICNGAFGACISLTSITFNGTIEEWNAIEKGDCWNDDVPAKKVVCSDGEVAL